MQRGDDAPVQHIRALVDLRHSRARSRNGGDGTETKASGFWRRTAEATPGGGGGGGGGRGRSGCCGSASLRQDSRSTTSGDVDEPAAAQIRTASRRRRVYPHSPSAAANRHCRGTQPDLAHVRLLQEEAAVVRTERNDDCRSSRGPCEPESTMRARQVVDTAAQKMLCCVVHSRSSSRPATPRFKLPGRADRIPVLRCRDCSSTKRLCARKFIAASKKWAYRFTGDRS